MASLGDIEKQFGRTYMAVNPSVKDGPMTWRLAVPSEIGSGQGGGSGIKYDFDGTMPIDVDTTPGAGDVTTVNTSMDLKQLEDRAK